MKIHLSRPDITEKEIQAVIDVLKTPYLSLGPKLEEFEAKFARYIGTRYAVAVNSGTSGLHLGIKSLGICKNDAVVTTSFSFIASANCIVYEGANPIFVDIEEKTLNIDPEKIYEYLQKKCVRCPKSGRPIDRDTGRTVKAILPVHVFGHPCTMDKILDIAGEYNLAVIEDACEAIGAKLDGQKVGTFGKLAVFAFYPNKQITTAEGGMIVTDDEKLALLCKSYRNQGRSSNGGWLAHKRLGYNYRLSDINCALGIAQLERINEILEKRKQVALIYNDLLNGIVQIPVSLDNVDRSWFVYVVCLPESFSGKRRDEILSYLNENGIASSNYFPPIHLQPFYQQFSSCEPFPLKITEAISRRTIALPFHTQMNRKDVDFVAKTLIEAIN